MIRQDIHIKEWGWTIHAFYSVTTYWVDEIMEMLWDVGCDGETARNAYDNLSEGKLNSGLCYSNYAKKRSVIVIAKTSSAEEFLNSMTHEASHACTHIASASFVDLRSEDYAYMVGDLCMAMYPKVKHLLCDCCRNKKTNDYEEEYGLR